MSQPPTRAPLSISSLHLSSGLKANGGDESLALGEDSVDGNTFALTSCSEIDAGGSMYASNVLFAHSSRSLDLTSRHVVRRQRSKNVADQTLNRFVVCESLILRLQPQTFFFRLLIEEALEV